MAFPEHGLFLWLMYLWYTTDSSRPSCVRIMQSHLVGLTLYRNLIDPYETQRIGGMYGVRQNEQPIFKSSYKCMEGGSLSCSKYGVSQVTAILPSIQSPNWWRNFGITFLKNSNIHFQLSYFSEFIRKHFMS